MRKKIPNSRLLGQLENVCLLATQFIFFGLVQSIWEILLTAFNVTSRV